MYSDNYPNRVELTGKKVQYERSVGKKLKRGWEGPLTVRAKNVHWPGKVGTPVVSRDQDNLGSYPPY